ncbi:MAG TPA: hypothetical protein VIG62_09255 [Blastocatellia bacterium]|jgi:hypothetical protein
MSNLFRAVGKHKMLCVLGALMLAAPAMGQIQFDRPKSEKPLDNPLIIGSARDEVTAIVKQMLETREIPLDKEDCNTTTGECTLISKPVVFIRGIPTRSQLLHYCEVPSAEVRNWVKGRYTLRFQISPASIESSQIGIYARFEGMTDGVTGNEWVQLTSKGELENSLLRCVQDRAQGRDCRDEER